MKVTFRSIMTKLKTAGFQLFRGTTMRCLGTQGTPLDALSRLDHAGPSTRRWEEDGLAPRQTGNVTISSDRMRRPGCRRPGCRRLPRRDFELLTIIRQGKLFYQQRSRPTPTAESTRSIFFSEEDKKY